MRPAILILAALLATPAFAGDGARPRRVQTFGGDVHLPAAPSGARITSFGGSVKVEESAEQVNATSYGGDVDLEIVDGNARATTYGGDVRIQLVSGDVTACSYGGDVEVGLYGNALDREREVVLRSYGGDVTLLVPPELPMDLEIEVRCAVGRDCPVSSDVAWDVDEEGEPSRRFVLFGEKKRLIRKAASVDGGGNRVTIRVEDGAVHVVRVPGLAAEER